MNRSVHPDSLEAFVAGQLSTAEADAVIAHLADCEHCLAEVDRLWAGRSPETAPLAWPELDGETAERLEHNLLRRIQRSQLGGQVVLLSTLGLLQVVVALLRPFLGRSQRPKPQGVRK